MKRSQMVEVLEQNILWGRGQLTAYQLAERLLTRIEQLGMLPPPHELLLSTDEIRHCRWEDE